MNKSLANPDGNALQPSEPDAVQRFSTLIGTQFSPTSEEVMILLTILLGITANTVSGDVMALSLGRASTLCDQLGLDHGRVLETFSKFTKLSKAMRRNLPFAW